MSIESESPIPGEDFRRVAFALRDGTMAGIAFGEESRAPDIVFLHATGFNARTYRALLQPLGERFHVVALDMRGHGRSTLRAGRLGYSSWLRHRDDVVAVLEKHFTAPVTLAGHSMGAIVSLLAAGRRPDLVRGLALIEPVILPPSAYAAATLPFAPLVGRYAFPIARSAARRRRRFPDHATAIRALALRGVFRNFSAETVADYVADGFVEDGDGVRLACKREYEAATFAAHRHDPWAALQRVSGPIVLLRAEHGSTMSAAAMRKFATMKPDARIATMEGAGHMLPMERPDRARAAIETAALMASPTHAYRDLE